MRAIFTSGLVAAVVASASAAYAADLPVRAAAPIPYVAAPVYSWTGVYAGIAGGFGWGTSHHAIEGFPTNFSGDFDVDGGIIGGTLGYNWQSGAFVFGVEGDLSATWIDGSTRGVAPTFCPPGGPGANCSTELDWLGTARVRVGYAWDRALPYITGGVAFGKVNGSTDNGANSGSDTRVGWTIGGGLEYMFTPNLTGKVEYLYVDLGTADNLFVRNPGNFPFDVEFRTSIVRVGLNYKFF